MFPTAGDQIFSAINQERDEILILPRIIFWPIQKIRNSRLILEHQELWMILGYYASYYVQKKFPYKRYFQNITAEAQILVVRMMHGSSRRELGIR